MPKIRELSIDGLRGVRKDLSLSLDSKSALLYGDNGTGKSTFSDVVEWFFYDRVDHLVSEEIGRKGYEALRNIYLDADQPAKASFVFNNSALDCSKNIENLNGRLVTSLSNESSDFKEYLINSESENLVLRYKDLLKFVISTKGDKLRDLSEIIGFSQVTKTRDVLRKAWNQLTREIVSKGFENQIGHQQSQIIEHFGQNVTTDEDFIKIVSSLVKDFDLGISIKSLQDVKAVLPKLRKPDDSAEIKQEAYVTKMAEDLVSLPINLDQLEKFYGEFKKRYEIIAADLDKIKRLALEQLLQIGRSILVGGNYADENCPLCLHEIDREKLVAELDERLIELEAIKKEDAQLAEARSALRQQINVTRRLITNTTDQQQTKDPTNSKRKGQLAGLLTQIDKYKGVLDADVLKKKSLDVEKDLLVDRTAIGMLTKDCNEDLQAIRKARTKDPKWDAHSKINIAGHAYAQIRALERERAVFGMQRDAMEEIYKRFVEAQKTALESFLSSYSSRINEIYQFLNPDERVENIRLVPIEKNGELAGLTIEYDFLDCKSTSPPQKYLSESHLNCLGLTIFLTSVEAFNKQNKFFILDDVISSFDVEHRKRFADLIVEKYTDYQVIVLTHERAWFEIIRNRAKQKGWVVHSVKHNDADGTHLTDPPKTLKARILEKVANSDEDGLGGDARKYLENLLKRIALNLEVKVAYRTNDINEERMSYELLTELKSKLKSAKCAKLQANPVIDRLIASTSIGNKDSHDNVAEMKFPDLKAFWNDVQEFESLFYCSDCVSLVSLANYDKVNKCVQCREGHLGYEWKK